jgi:uncharacterized protein YegL
MWKAVKGYLEESVANKCNTELDRWNFNLRQAAAISFKSPNAAEEFIRMGSRVCLVLDETQTINWVQSGLTECDSETELITFFGAKSLRALENRDSLVGKIQLKDKIGTLSLICEAFLGRPLKIRSNTTLIGVRDFTGGPATDGRAIYLPETSATFTLMKLSALHQAALMTMDDWINSYSSDEISSSKIHQEADRRVLEKLPKFRSDMLKLCPNCFDDEDHLANTRVPWWGDLLPGLVHQTQRVISKVSDAFEEQDIPPELLEAFLETLWAKGDRDPNSLTDRLAKMLDEIEFESPDAEDLEDTIRTFFYKEWDSELHDYKLDWVLVRERSVKEDPNPFAQQTADRLRGIVKLVRNQFVRLRPQNFKKLKAQSFGDDLDIDALIQAIVEMKSGSHMREDIYIRRDKRIRDVAVLFLVDLSGSTEEQVNGRRVIDIQKEAMTLMAEALDSLGDPFAIYGFCSEGRFRVDLFSVKSFEDDYQDAVRFRLGNLEPANLTRMGAVIRHGIAKLEPVDAMIKVMIIITDGRPYDLEYGNLDYAMADTRKAFKEARSKRIHPFVITSDDKGITYLRQICSQTQSIILPKVEVLPRILPALYKRLTL